MEHNGRSFLETVFLYKKSEGWLKLSSFKNSAIPQKINMRECDDENSVLFQTRKNMKVMMAEYLLLKRSLSSSEKVGRGALYSHISQRNRNKVEV